MGEISELTQEGVLCKECGCLIEDLIQKGTNQLKEGPGYPCLCEDCKSQIK